jgi:hypothetical protein
LPGRLLLDLPALIGIALSFGPLMIMAIGRDRRAMFGENISPRIQDCIMHMLPIAEAQLHYALCRLAWRRSAGTSARSGSNPCHRRPVGPTSPHA